MKRVSGGTLGFGIFAFGWALSVGFISFGMNAVGWIAVGMNAAGFVAIGLINSVGVFSFGGVNSCGGWGRGGVNEGPSTWFGLVVSFVLAVGLLIYRIKNWPTSERPLLVPLGREPDESEWSPARIAEIGGDIALRDGATTLRAEVSPALVARCRELGRGARVIVRLSRTTRAVEGAGYRDDAGETVLELVEITGDPRVRRLAALFQGVIGYNLAFSLLGLASAIAAFVLWR